MIAEAVGDPDLTDAEVDDVRQALVSVGAVAEVERRIEAMTENALTALRKASLAEPAAQRLVELADPATRRTS